MRGLVCTETKPTPPPTAPRHSTPVSSPAGRTPSGGQLMRAHGLLAPQRARRPRDSKAHDGTITTDRVDLMWGTDLTSVVTGEGQAAVFVAVDHCSAECVGI